MKVLLKSDNKTIEFISGTTEINVNDDFVQTFEVVPKIPLTDREELRVVFQTLIGESATHSLPLLKTQDFYRTEIPESLIVSGGVFSLQIFRRRYSTTGETYRETASNSYSVGIGGGVKNAKGENVTITMITTLYHEAETAIETSTANATNAEASKNQAEVFATNAGTSAGEAKTSETNAAASEANAKTSENNAEQYAISALTSSQTASTSAETAVNAKANAEAARSIAEESAIKANESAQKAESQASTVNSMWQDSLVAAERAETSAQNASSSASAANESAEQAMTAAQNAQDAENNINTTLRDVAKAKSFDNYGELVTHLKNDVLAIPYTTGQPFYIIETDVPDLWVSAVDLTTNHAYSYTSASQFLTDLDNNGGKLWVGNYQLAKLETAKVYLDDLQKKTDSRLQTSSKEVVGAINEVNSKAVSASNKATAIENAKGKACGYASLNAIGQVPSEQLPDLNYQRPTDERLTTDSKEIYGAINELDGRLDNIGETIEEKVEPTTEKVEVIETALEQANIITQETVESAYDSRITANGKKILNASFASLKKIVGNTVVYDKDENGLNGKIANVTFSGIKSTSPNGEESVLEFPETELPLGDEIDFENKKITKYGVTIVLTGDEDEKALKFYPYPSGANQRNGIRIFLKNAENFAKGFCTDGEVVEDGSQLNSEKPVVIGYNNSTNVFFVGFTDRLGITTAGQEPTDITAVISNVKSYLAQRYADGNPVTIHYVSSTLQRETEFDNSDEYKSWYLGAENVLGNDGAKHGALPTISTDYDIVNEIGSGGGGSTGGGGLSANEVKTIADSSASTALTEAKTYTDNKSVGSASASVDENNVLTVEIKDNQGNVLATTTVTLPSGGGGGGLTATDLPDALVNEFNTPTKTLTDSDKTNACAWLGALKQNTAKSSMLQAYGKLASGDQYMINAQYGEPTANDSGNGYLTVTFYKNVIKPLLDTLKS